MANAVHRLRHAYREPLESAPERVPAVAFDDQVQMVGLDRELEDAKVVVRGGANARCTPAQTRPERSDTGGATRMVTCTGWRGSRRSRGRCGTLDRAAARGRPAPARAPP
jgi:hypothetical protein